MALSKAICECHGKMSDLNNIRGIIAPGKSAGSGILCLPIPWQYLGNGKEALQA